MSNFLVFFAIILFIIVAITMVNEKTLKRPNEIIILCVSLILGIILSVLDKYDVIGFTPQVMTTINTFRIDRFLLEVLLCFMLFSGASEVKLNSLIKNFKPITLLAFIATFLSSALFGAMFYGLAYLIGLDINFTLCFLLGSIVSPTDPIAATGILCKLGMSDDLVTTIAGESLFNDGVGVAIFVFLKSLYTNSKAGNFIQVMAKEIIGALVVGFLVSIIFFKVLKLTKDPIKHIMISLIAVILCYTICEHFEFSGVIASVICGIYFSSMHDKYIEENPNIDRCDWYDDFWKIVDTLMNYILYVMIGISFVYVVNVAYTILIIVAVVIFNILSRFVGVFVSSVMVRNNPGHYSNKNLSVLLTWSGLKGGLCLALAISTNSFIPENIYNYLLIVTFSIIVFTTIVQGLTIPYVYKKIQHTLPKEL
ncbi:MAG: sodium:proton antiporter [Lachnospiraceae bacterium]|nr:sodium:proton antiporter [Lachnospiraceae bacterium]